MLYLVDMTLASHTRTPEEGVDFISNLILPTLAAGRELEAKGTIVAGGLKPAGNRLALAASPADSRDPELKGRA